MKIYKLLPRLYFGLNLITAEEREEMISSAEQQYSATNISAENDPKLHKGVQGWKAVQPWTKEHDLKVKAEKWWFQQITPAVLFVLKRKAQEWAHKPIVSYAVPPVVAQQQQVIIDPVTGQQVATPNAPVPQKHWMD